IKKMGKLGVFGMNIPKEFGGLGMDTLTYIMTVEELAKVDSSVAATLVAHNSLGVVPVMDFGSQKQKEKYLPGFTTGENVWAFGLTEQNAGSDAMGVETTAELHNGNWNINGNKLYITNGGSPITQGITALVSTGENKDKKQLTTILVETGTPGFTQKTMHGKMLWRAANNADIKFENCKVPGENILGQPGEGGKIMLKTLDGGRLSVAAMGLGLARGAYQMAKAYAKKRRQFGKPISHYQVIAFKLADMEMKIENARNTLYNACWLKDTGKPYGKQAAIAKLYCSEIAKEVADEALQVFGASGLMKNNPIERFYRDQRLLQIGEGTSEIIRLVVSRQIMKETDD
ncbi:MAG: acyl-CoA dehydrogenase family protein, partial [Bacteroidales bacterium]|nr:acyl-CoA dehydrogenase family protein [Bacteroidales bacterium]